MSDIIIIVLAVVVPIAWLIAEFRGPRVLRITLGLACILVLISAWRSSRQSTAIHDSLNRATIHMLGETLDRGDTTTAREAIRVYESEDDWHPGLVTIDFLEKHKPQAP